MSNEYLGREKFPFLLIIVLAILVVAIILYGPEINRYVTNVRLGVPAQFDPIAPVVDGLSNFANAVSNMFAKFTR